jgi:cell division control protein 6
MVRDLKGYFESFLQKKPLFKNKMALQSNYTPDMIHHRDKQIEALASILAPLLRLEKPSNIFIYGKAGTGKTLTAKYIINQLEEMAEEKGLPIKFLYVNCKLKKVADTEYRIIAHFAREFGKNIPPTGLPTDEIYKIFYSAVEKEKKLILIVLDEIDQLVKKIGDEVLYNLTRINSQLQNSQISLIGISNHVSFTDELEARVKSSLSEEELTFPPYHALEIQSILKERVRIAFYENSLEDGLIEKCAAYAARDHGDARRAIELLRVAAEIAEREGSDKVFIKHLDMAEDKIDKDKIIEIVSTLPKQHQSVLSSIIQLENKIKLESKSNIARNFVSTGIVYDYYKALAESLGLRPLTQRRVSDIIAEFDMLGLINVNVISKGRYGRTREINVVIPSKTLEKVNDILLDELGIKS